MSAQVIPLVSEDAVDEAWRELCEHRQRIVEDPACLAEREFVEQDIRLHNRFSRLFTRLDGGRG